MPPTLPTSFGDALHWAAHQGHADIITVLLATIDGRAALNETDHLGRTALLVAAERQNTHAMTALLDAGADGSLPDLIGRTADHILHGHLIRMQPSVEEAQSELAALVAATPGDALERSAAGQRARALMEQGADPGRWTDKGSTLMHDAVANGQRSLVRAFLEHPNALRNSQRTDRFDRSPLLMAIESHAGDDLLDDLLHRGGVRSQMLDAIAAARTLGAPARAQRLERIHQQDLQAERSMALELMAI
jgi:ankyrin repeat protein